MQISEGIGIVYIQRKILIKYCLFAETVHRHDKKGTGSNISATRYAANKRSRDKYCGTCVIFSASPPFYGEIYGNWKVLFVSPQ